MNPIRLYLGVYTHVHARMRARGHMHGNRDVKKGMVEMLEKDIEKILVTEIKKIGGAAYKFVSPGNSGVPDRILILPDARIVFAELKTDKGEPTVLQEVQIRRLRGLGQTVCVVKGISGVASLLFNLGYPDRARDIRKKYKIGGE